MPCLLCSRQNIHFSSQDVASISASSAAEVGDERCAAAESAQPPLFWGGHDACTNCGPTVRVMCMCPRSSRRDGNGEREHSALRLKGRGRLVVAKDVNSGRGRADVATVRKEMLCQAAACQAGRLHGLLKDPLPVLRSTVRTQDTSHTTKQTQLCRSTT